MVLEGARLAGEGPVPRAEQLPHSAGLSCPTSEAQWGLSRRILGSCTGLMQAIHVLVLASKDLQREIVESGRVSKDRAAGRAWAAGAWPAGGRHVLSGDVLLAGASALDARSSCPSPRVSPWLQSPGSHQGP